MSLISRRHSLQRKRHSSNSRTALKLKKKETLLNQVEAKESIKCNYLFYLLILHFELIRNVILTFENCIVRSHTYNTFMEKQLIYSALCIKIYYAQLIVDQKSNKNNENQFNKTHYMHTHKITVDQFQVDALSFNMIFFSNRDCVVLIVNSLKK